MPNVNYPHGLRPLGRTLSGGFPTIENYQKAATDALALFEFDAVSRAGGFVTGTSVPGTTDYLGVNLNPGIASTLTNHLVSISPDAMYEAQDDDGATGFLAADMGLNANLALNAPSVIIPGSGFLGLSGHVIHYASKAATATLDVHLHRLYAVSDNAFGPHSRIEISFGKAAGATIDAASLSSGAAQAASASPSSASASLKRGKEN